MFNLKFALRWTAAVATVGFAASTASAASLTEGFATTTTLLPLPVGWTAVNNSDVQNSVTESWIKGGTLVTAQAGTSTSYISASFNATYGDVISDWLILPTLSFNNGDVFSFYTRTLAASQFPDRLEVRFSNVGGTNVGTTPTGIGDFSSLLLTINPTLALGGYSEAWTPYTLTMSGLSGATNGALAFRYYVTGTGDFTNGNFIAIDTVAITAVPEPAAYLTMALGLGALALRHRTKRA